MERVALLPGCGESRRERWKQRKLHTMRSPNQAGTLFSIEFTLSSSEWGLDSNNGRAPVHEEMK